MISLIIPTYNEEKVIGPTLAQFSGYDPQTLEIIVSDAESKDKTHEIVHGFPNVKLVVSPKSTIGGGRNDGAKHAQGAILFFIDADVRIPRWPELFRAIEEKFAHEPRLGAMTLKLRVYPGEETFWDMIWWRWWNNALVWFLNNVTHTGGAAGECQIIRKRFFDQVSGYRMDLVAAEDYDMFSRIARIARTYQWRAWWMYSSPRRFRKQGWPKILWQWFLNFASVKLGRKAVSKEWTPVR